MPEDKRVNAGHLKISELIELLVDTMNEYGDLPTCGSYDGNWNEDVYIQVLDDRVIIGNIS